MKILFLGDYSNLHACLADELRRQGHRVTVASDGGAFMQTDADVRITRGKGLAGAAVYLYRLFSLLPSWSGYDVVQLINPHFLKLKPGKIRYFFNALRKQNRSVFLTLCGNDHFFVKACLDDTTFRFSEYSVGDKRTRFFEESPERYGIGYLQRDVADFAHEVYDNIDGAMSVLPEYDIVARPLLGDRLAFTNIPIDLSCHPYSFNDPADGPVRIFIGMKTERNMPEQKGTRILLETAKELEREMPDRCAVTRVSDLPLRDYLAAMSGSHIVLDQLYAYSPATNALNAMALGPVAATGAEEEYYRYIGEESRPLIPLSPLIPDLKEHLALYVREPERLRAMSAEARKIVEKHNDVRIVAARFTAHWNRILERKG